MATNQLGQSFDAEVVSQVLNAVGSPDEIAKQLNLNVSEVRAIVEKDEESTHNHYNSKNYQYSVGFERVAINGMIPEEVYKKEAAFAMRVANITPEMFGEDEGILDVASGAGNHSFEMSDALGHQVPIIVTEPAEELSKMAHDRFEQRREVGVDEQLRFVSGADNALMQNLSSANPELAKQKNRVITILGYSFVYTNLRESQQALENMWNLLEPGGRLVIQWRQRPNIEDDEYKQRVGDANAKSRAMGIEWVQDGEIDGQSASYYLATKDTAYCEAGEKYQFIDKDCRHPDLQQANDYKEQMNANGHREWIHNNTGTRSFAYSRVLHKKDGRKVNFPTATIHQICWDKEDRGTQTMRDLMEGVGFEDVQFKQPESDDDWLGPQRIVALVAKKPL